MNKQTGTAVELFLELCGGPGVVAYELEHDGEQYIVTDGTGDGCFIYVAFDVKTWAENAEDGDLAERYNDFCQSVDAVSEGAVVRAAWREHGLIACEQGTCTPLLPRDVDSSDFLCMFDSMQAAGDFEQRVLNSGREFLPECAAEVLDGAEGTPDYWQWMIEQAEKARADGACSCERD